MAGAERWIQLVPKLVCCVGLLVCVDMSVFCLSARTHQSKMISLILRLPPIYVQINFATG